jgi:hypothetical protein
MASAGWLSAMISMKSKMATFFSSIDFTYCLLS